MLVADNIPTGTIARVRHVINFLAEQGKPAYDTKIMDCKYRLGETACAVGCLIPDSKYDEKFEFNDVHNPHKRIRK